MKKIFLCAINNILSGTCNEDCKFCTQSTKYKADIQGYKFKSIKQIVSEAKIAKANWSFRILLSYGQEKGLDDQESRIYKYGNKSN